MRFSEDLFVAVGLARQPVHEASVRLFAPVAASRSVPMWFMMLYQIFRATVPVLRHALSKIETGDTFADKLRACYQAKAEEEEGHDRMMLADLSRLGVTSGDLSPANPFIAEMVGRQYFLIDFVHPAAHLGYLGLLESSPATLEQVDALQRSSGLPAEAFSTARLHAKADVGHREELAAVLDAAPPRWRPDILANGIRCAALLCGAVEVLAHATKETTCPT